MHVPGPTPTHWPIGKFRNETGPHPSGCVPSDKRIDARLCAFQTPPTAPSLGPRCSRFSLLDTANPEASSEPEPTNIVSSHLPTVGFFALPFVAVELATRAEWLVDRAELPSCRRRSAALWLMHPAATERVPVDSPPCSLRRTDLILSLRLSIFCHFCHCDAATGSCNVAPLCNFQPPTCATLAPHL
jgi:hypothetical protein